jgi:hypothetical protein
MLTMVLRYDFGATLDKVLADLSEEEGRLGELKSTLYGHNSASTLAVLEDAHDAPFRWRDIAQVSAAWSSAGEDIWRAGFVVKLHDGRRAYIDAFLGVESGAFESVGGDEANEEPASITVMWLKEGQRYPELGANHYQRLFGWSDEPGLETFVTRLQKLAANAAVVSAA